MATVLIIGSGPNIGLSSAKRFANAGYKVAIASRTVPQANTLYKHFVFDAEQPTTVPKLFADVTAAIGTPSVVIYNAAKRLVVDPEHALALSLADYESSMAVNSTTPYMAAQAAVEGFTKASVKGTFIFTGNKLNVVAFPRVLAFGMGKSAASHLIQGAALGYKEKGYRFYYVDGRQDNGDAVYEAVDGDAHASLFIELVEDMEQRPWLQTFVKGKGYKAFNEIHE